MSSSSLLHEQISARDLLYTAEQIGYTVDPVNER